MSQTPNDNLDQAKAPLHGDQSPMTCPPFDPAMFHRQLTMDSAGRTGVFVAVLLALIASWVPTLAGQMESVFVFVFVLVAVAWIGLNSISSRVAAVRWQNHHSA